MASCAVFGRSSCSLIFDTLVLKAVNSHFNCSMLILKDERKYSGTIQAKLLDPDLGFLTLMLPQVQGR